MSEANNTFEKIGDLVKSLMELGDNIVRYQKSVLVCIRCIEPLVTTSPKLGSYTCPKCGLRRNDKQRFYLATRSYMEFRQVGLNETSKKI